MKKKTIIITSVVLSVLMVAGVLGTGFAIAAIGKGGALMHRPEMWDREARGIGYGWHAGIAPFIFFKLFILLAVVAILVFLVVKGFAYKKAAHQVPGSNALEILKERYAKGEISKEELEAMKKDILE